jgi:hypothetical protein
MTTDEKIAHLEGRIEELSNQLDALMVAQIQHGWPSAITVNPYIQPYVVTTYE